ncbi:MAG: TraR/DksA C4-type zinc finger protein [Bryobacteraceae bacterium]
MLDKLYYVLYYGFVSFVTLIDAVLAHKFCPSLQTAQQQAAGEAADTGGVVLQVKSLRIELGAVVVTGLIPSSALSFENVPETVSRLRPRSMGTLHLTWNSLLHASASDVIGYLVLQTPVVTASHLSLSEDDDWCWGALTIQRAHYTLPSGCIGAICCVRCNRPIASQRLNAVPHTKLCTACQQNKEMKDD